MDKDHPKDIMNSISKTYKDDDFLRRIQSSFNRGRRNCQANNKLRFKKLRAEAVIPHKNHKGEDAGYDLTITHLAFGILTSKQDEGKKVSAKAIRENLPAYASDRMVYMFGTGIAVEPPAGYYIDLVPRSSISKTGWHLKNSVGVIDAGYRNEIHVPLVKDNPYVDMLDLPIRLMQLVLRPLEDFEVEVTDTLSDSKRGKKGFGSSGQ